MIAVHATRPGLQAAAKLTLLLAEAAANDPYLEKIAGDPRHCHGYGYTLATLQDHSWRITHERYDAHPNADHEQACNANLHALRQAAQHLAETISRAQEAILILHARRAGRGEPRGHTAAHPFREETILLDNGNPTLAELYLAHNGGVRKEEIAQKLGLQHEKDTYTDSHLILKLIAQKLRNTRVENLHTHLENTINQIKPHTKSALDLLILTVTRRKPRLYAYGYVASKDTARQRYYQPIIIQGEGYQAYVSSTIHDLAKEHGLEIQKYNVINQKLIEITANNTT